MKITDATLLGFEPGDLAVLSLFPGPPRSYVHEPLLICLVQVHPFFLSGIFVSEVRVPNKYFPHHSIGEANPALDLHEGSLYVWPSHRIDHLQALVIPPDELPMEEYLARNRPGAWKTIEAYGFGRIDRGI